MTSWYAIRTAPGAQMPKREYWTEEATRSAKGYRIQSGVASDYSAVELALKDAGFTYYMPAEFSAVRNRRKSGLYEVRRFALMKGYMFVSELQDEDWPRLLGGQGFPGVPGVQGVVSNHNTPFAISSLDLFRLRMFEQKSRAEAQAKASSLSKAGERLVREQRKVVVRGARKKLFPGREVKLIWGDKVGREATVQAWDDQDNVKVLLQSLDAAAETITVPFEFLKVGT
jgi:hypothetical protein